VCNFREEAEKEEEEEVVVVVMVGCVVLKIDRDRDCRCWDVGGEGPAVMRRRIRLREGLGLLLA
jgi:hypothetical protein